MGHVSSLMGGFIFPWLIMSGTYPCPPNMQPCLRLRNNSLSEARQGPSSSGNPSTLTFWEEDCAQPALGPPVLSSWTHSPMLSKLSPAGDWQRSRLVGWRGLSKMFLTELGSQTLPLSRQKLIGLTETTYCNMTIWMAKLQQHIFILITAAGILICWHPELLLCH